MTYKQLMLIADNIIYDCSYAFNNNRFEHRKSKRKNIGLAEIGFRLGLLLNNNSKAIKTNSGTLIYINRFKKSKTIFLKYFNIGRLVELLLHEYSQYDIDLFDDSNTFNIKYTDNRMDSIWKESLYKNLKELKIGKTLNDEEHTALCNLQNRCMYAAYVKEMIAHGSDNSATLDKEYTQYVIGHLIDIIFNPFKCLITDNSNS